jgi:hypothetical protein
LGPGESGVGGVDERVHVGGARRERGNADGDCQAGQGTIGRAVQSDGAADFFGNAKRASPGSAGEDGDDPIVVETGDDIAGSDQAARDFAHVPDQTIHLGATEQILNTVLPIDRHAQN